MMTVSVIVQTAGEPNFRVVLVVACARLEIEHETIKAVDRGGYYEH